MQVKRILLGLLWIAWAGFWQVIARETLGLPHWLTLVALVILPIAFNLVPNWWMATSGWISFLLFGVAGGIGMWAWSEVSPCFQYEPAGRLPIEWFNLGLFWAYIGDAIGRTRQTLELHWHPDNWLPLFRQFLHKGWDWQIWKGQNQKLFDTGQVPNELSDPPVNVPDPRWK